MKQFASIEKLDTGILYLLGGVGGRRVAIAGTFPTAPPRTGLAPFSASGSPVSSSLPSSYMTHLAPSLVFLLYSLPPFVMS